MKNTMMIFARHGESQKNLKDIMGGEGEIITDNGLKQANDLALKISSWIVGVNDVNVIASNFHQTIQTAESIGKILKQEVIVTNKLTSAGMGVFGKSLKPILSAMSEWGENYKASFID